MRYYIIYLSTLIILCHCFEAAACQLLRYPYSSTLFCSHYLFFLPLLIFLSFRFFLHTLSSHPKNGFNFLTQSSYFQRENLYSILTL